MADRIDVYCTACRHRGKARVGAGPGACTKCGGSRVFGVPPKGGTVGRPRLTEAERLRRTAAELLAIADALDGG